MSGLTPEQREEVERMIAAAAPRSRWDVAFEEYAQGKARGYTKWMDIGRRVRSDGSVEICTLKDALTGEVVSR